MREQRASENRINRCHQCPDYPKGNPSSGYMCETAGKQVFASTHSCMDMHRLDGTPMPAKVTRWVPKAKPAPAAAQKPLTTGTETPTMERICARLDCEKPALDGKRICQKHYDIVVAGQKKRTDIKHEATEPVQATEPVVDNAVEPEDFNADEPVQDRECTCLLYTSPSPRD